jgi:hypothetical protein
MSVRRMLRGLHASVSGNAQAFRFSITITVTYGAISSAQGSPTLPELFGFALAAVAAFSMLNLAIAAALRNAEEGGEPDRVVLVATATDVLAVGAALAAAVGIRAAFPGWGAWLLAPFCAALVYVLVQSVELAVGLREADRRDADVGS